MVQGSERIVFRVKMFMAPNKFKFIYGPVYSWRMGMSLGIDPLSTSQKYCHFSCPYCQLGVVPAYGVDRKVFVSAVELAAEIRSLPETLEIDYLTFSGNGEPTLAANLGELIKAARDARPEKVAIITNAVLAGNPEARQDMALADLVLLKLDAADEAVFRALNCPAPGITLAGILAGIGSFKKMYKGKLALQIMLTGRNKAQAAALASLAAAIAPDEVQLNTPLRPSPVKPLTVIEMTEAKQHFVEAGLNVISVYEEEKKFYQPMDESATKKRHGKYDGTVAP